MVFGVWNLQSRAEGFTKFGLGDRKKIRADERGDIWKNFGNPTRRKTEELKNRKKNGRIV